MKCEYCQRKGIAGTQCSGCGARVPAVPKHSAIQPLALPKSVLIPSWVLAPIIAFVVSAFGSGFMLAHRLAYVQEQLALTVEQSAILKDDLRERDAQLRQHVDMLHARSIVLEQRIRRAKDR